MALWIYTKEMSIFTHTNNLKKMGLNKNLHLDFNLESINEKRGIQKAIKDTVFVFVHVSLKMKKDPFD